MKDRWDGAWGAFVTHSVELDRIVDEILDHAKMGDTQFSLESYTDLSDEDINYIKREVQRRY